MGARQSGPRKIRVLRHIRHSRKRAACHRKIRRTCRDSCRVTEPAIDYEILVKRLNELGSTADESDTGSPQIGIDFGVNTASCQTSETVVAKEGTPLTITCDKNVGNLVEFLGKNLCEFGNAEEAGNAERCGEEKPHLHGHLNGVPIILKLVDTTEEAIASGCIVKQDGNTEAELPRARNRPCDIQNKKNAKFHISRRTSPMTRIQSANTSPCSVSKECLKSANYTFLGAKCSRDKECVEKCATSELSRPEEQKIINHDHESKPGYRTSTEDPEGSSSSDVQREKKSAKKSPKGGKRKKVKGNESSRSTPRRPTPESKPVSDASAAPRHIWFGKGVHAAVNEESKPKSTFNSENTGVKKKSKSEPKKKETANRNQEFTSANLAVSLKKFPFKMTEIGEEILPQIYSKEENERSQYTGDKYLSHSKLFGENSDCVKNFVNFGTAFDPFRNVDEIPASKYAFLFIPTKESYDKRVLRAFQNPWDYVPGANYFAAPVRLPKLHKIWYNKVTRSRKKSYSADVDRNERTLIIARTPPLNANGALIMAAKTVITVRENAFIRRYSDNCGAEEITPARSEVLQKLFKRKRESSENESAARGKKSGGFGWSRKSSRRFLKPETLGVPLLIISKESNSSTGTSSSRAWSIRRTDSRNLFEKLSNSDWSELPILKLKRPRGIFKTSKDPGLELPAKNDRESSQSEKSFELFENSDLRRNEEWDENVCFASQPTRYCEGKTRKRKFCSKGKNLEFGRSSRVSKGRKESAKPSSATVGFFDSVKKSYKNRFRPFFANRSKPSLKKIGRIFKSKGGKSSEVEIFGCGNVPSEDADFPVTTADKLTCTSGSNSSFFKIKAQDLPQEKVENESKRYEEVVLIPRVNSSLEEAKSGGSSYPQPCECPENPSDKKSIAGETEDNSFAVCNCPASRVCDGLVVKAGSVLPCGSKRATSPTQTETVELIEKRKKCRWKLKKRKNGR